MTLSPAEWSALRLSLLTGLAATLASLPIAIAVGYGLARRWRGKWLIETFVNLPLVMPPVVTGWLLLLLLGRNGPVGRLLEPLGLRIAFTWLGCVAAAAVMGFPLMTRAIRLAFQSVDPRLEAAARTLGAGPLAVFFRISFPLASRGVAAGAILGFARGLGEFGATIMLAGNIPGMTRTLPLAIYSIVQTPGGDALAWRLVALSVALACVALGAGEWLELRHRRHE